jgi:pyridinium-3,5-bisthiocarboxylic acid mononucleotide nickel chelatase
MRIAYLDCFAGISGDMFLGALLDAGLDPQILHDATAALNLGASLQIEKVDRSGISCTKVHVLEDGKLAEAPHTHDEPHTHTHFQDQRPAEDPTHQHQPKTQHLHKTGHSHTHEEEHTHEHSHSHAHDHGRSLSVIRELIQSANLASEVKQTAIKTFELLGASEAKIHNVDIEKIHFHEVGAVDAIVDIVAASAGIHALKIDKWFCSPLNVGGGMVDCAHGRFPVPAPATFAPQPAMRVQHIGYGAGTRNTKGFPNVLRLNIGDTTDSTQGSVAVLETAIDDISPQILAYVTETALQQGALDVMSTAVQMKKGRLGTLITILADDDHVPALEQLLLRETSTLGIRIHHERRSCLDRTHTTVTTPYGDIRIKIGSRNGEIFNAAPEFEDCRTAATKHNIAIKTVQQAATSAYLQAKQ